LHDALLCLQVIETGWQIAPPRQQSSDCMFYHAANYNHLRVCQ
jgi:hypothetical protein